jgi:hypothetical protein
MARIFGSRAPRRNRYRIYTILSLVIIVAIIVYLYWPGGENSDQTRTGLITNSNGTTVYSDTASNPEQTNDKQNSGTSDSSLQGVSPDWANLPDNGTEQVSQGQNITPRLDTTVQPTGVGEITTAMKPPVTQVTSEADKLIAEAASLLNQGVSQIIPARDKFNEALRSSTISAQQAKFVKEKLSNLADDWLFSRSVLVGDTLCEFYKVQSGDQLRIIGEKHKVPYEILMKLNNISDPKSLRAGQTLKIVDGPFHAKVYRSTFTMDVYLKNTYVRSFTVGLGVPGSETPTGIWKVKVGGKLIEPEWTDPTGHTFRPTDPDYPLGSRWIALEGVSGNAVGKEGFAIHGTHKPEQLGTQGSQGCIRLENGNAVLVYNMLFPAYSTVEVLD